MLQKEKSERKMREMGERQSAFHRDINWTGLCRTAALSFSHQQSKLRTFQIFVSLLNIFTGSFTATCLIFKCSLNKVIVFCFSFHCHAVRTLCCTLGWLFVMEITATSNNCLKSQNTHTHRSLQLKDWTCMCICCTSRTREKQSRTHLNTWADSL